MSLRHRGVARLAKGCGTTTPAAAKREQSKKASPVNYYRSLPERPLQDTLRVVDLFCGAGGLSCGFDNFNGARRFKTVLGIDNDPSAIKIFNRNFRSLGDRASLPIGRVADMTWFQHPTEIRLFYLVHLAGSSFHPELFERLNEIGLSEFLARIRNIDKKFSSLAAEISQSDDYVEELSRVPPQTFTLALVKAFVNRLGVSSFSRPLASTRSLPWGEECESLLENAEGEPALGFPNRELVHDMEQEWSARFNEIQEAAGKSGRGQNSNNSKRLTRLCEFLSTDAFSRLKEAWIDWRASRASVRAEFCLENKSQLEELYFDRYRAHIVLGGPPCKGFSRIGRPVIQSLRDQGVHAWSHKEYGDERNALMVQYVLFLEALQPEVFLFENVSNFQSALKTPNGTFDAPALLVELIEELATDKLTYHVSHQVINARDYAVPQDRRRFIMFGAKAGAAPHNIASKFFELKSAAADVPLRVALTGLSDPQEFDPKGGIKTDHSSAVYDVWDPKLPPEQRDYLSWVQQPDPVSGVRPAATDAHIFRKPRDDDRVFASFVAPGIRWMDLKVDRSQTLQDLRDGIEAAIEEVQSSKTKHALENLLGKVDGSLMLRLLLEHTKERFKLPEQHLLLEGYLKNGGSTHGDWFERLSATKPCRTIVAHIGKDTYAYWHPTEPRSLTIREAARVQSFPDFFRFDVSGVVDTYSAIGNAVPPLLSRLFAARISELAEEIQIFPHEGECANHKTDLLSAS
ncbi:DNA-cytosine methyltransferase [Rhodovulum iodosum]|uniref:DNA (cytosine-5-)-methyltransferase n=1 Tax=Rhodovulum iodosum TaxID=68291 RepID=A0ABV3XTB1_9RHOB|nr:DNA (cytosine-5-)-methyltransferase [Rhodovulum robiginosum]RSK32022.1 DNA (cytosine-5-)-methyltransferase [Rhodovulum robiginosum]